MYHKSKLGLALSLALSSSFVAANTADAQTQHDIETIVVTANKLAQSIDQTLASVQVIDRAQIEQLNVRDVLSVLETQAGIQVNRNGGQGQNASLFVRGLESRYSLILIDGVRVGSATLGYKSLSTLPLNSVERIEVVKGSRAAQYGSDALAGVINIITRQSQGHSIALTTGSNSYASLEGTSRFTTEYVDIALNAGYERTEGFDVLENDATNFADPDKDGYDNLNLGLNLTHNNALLGQLGFIAQYSTGEVEFDDRWTPESTADKTEYENYHVNFHWLKEFVGIKNKFDLSYSKDQDTTFGFHLIDAENVKYDAAQVSFFETARLQFDYLASYKISEQLAINGGLNWFEESIDVNSIHNTVYDEEERTVYSAFGGAYYDDGNFLANVAVRHDDYDEVGSEQTYNIAGGIYLHQDAVLRVSQSSGFKAPTFNDLYYPGSGNPELEAETSVNRELGLRIDFDSLSVDVAAFRNELTNKIAWAPAPTADNPYSWSPFNIAEARYEGVELTTNFAFYGFDNTLNVSYIDAQKVDNSPTALEKYSDLPFVAKENARYSIAKQWHDLDINLSVAYQSEQKSTLINKIPSRIVWDLAANYQIQQQLTVSARIENLFDKEYIPSQGYGVDIDGDWVNDAFYHYNEIGRQLFVGIAYDF
ncbi:TonB-dependent receptor domain-containing protein [Pseudoalteromonas spongiae]|uniref:TonB-dependent receptor domain-containing protein n=1 Tax=Pseudoalteromonas spongiae TaxID=298657 RepID=UPI000C2D255B|nr:TonB-dependent receptor [Pseudoalteromonas spongiae]